MTKVLKKANWENSENQTKIQNKWHWTELKDK